MGTLRAACAYAAITLVLLMPLPLHLGSAVPGPLGDQLLVMGILAWETRQLENDPAHLFEMPILHPSHHALAYSEHLLGALPVALPVIALTGNAILAFNLILILSFILSALFMRLLVFELTGHAEAAFLSGLLYACTQYRLQNLPHLNLLLACWMPLSLVGLVRFARAPSAGAFAIGAAAYTMQALSSWYYAFYFGLALLGAVALWLSTSWRSVQISRRLVAAMAWIAVPLAALLVATAIPYLTLQSELPGYRRELSEMAPLSADPRDWLVGSSFSRSVGAATAPFRTEGDEHALFPGFAASLLLVAAWRRRSAPLGWIERTGWLLLVSAFVLSLGPTLHFGGGSDLGPDPSRDTGIPLPYRILYGVVPGFSSLRAPARFASVFSLAAAMLAGLGFARGFPAGTRRSRAASAGLALLACAEFWPVPLPLSRVPSYRDAPEIYRLLREAPEGAVAFIDAGALQSPPTWSPNAEAWQVYWQPFHGHPTVNGFTGFVPPQFVSYRQRIAGFPGPDSLALLRERNVRYAVLRPADFGAGWRGLAASMETAGLLRIGGRDGDVAYRVAAR